ncbi:hypothetical protein H112_07811 [Trichophyton rubrum D6]|uniref:Nicotinamide N-methyltransferase n=3 Tax=Trichophyton TaxID=5550 RepID=F2SFI5_TRIRC|nr:uncharacterized protein TERG_00399 [Trichophyton rubrum CBS 118892]EZF11095.1 hypothetical protein H100_07836 [Trichophyton rubrum MR850]EZF37884.1 hypothetical protein H102_07799 [Trichophyton rubrum CBS 100081]EZF48516.1 hypothetical protein H103_07822 [Trichophyton rubrum CBS 288.86]EZF59244.1 hypothetical protein H104_07771 [Trichophyton rubrum CBS 289.86]EZF69697.1 hypothetical protein H105_07823 [Trichophyton soudanense CBS 452.61]EZF80450.1 hypothetical protein H110_07821 [Trichophy
MFLSRFRSDDEEEAEDLLASFLPVLFPDSTTTCVGQPGQQLVYSSPAFGELALTIPVHPRDQGKAAEAAEAAADGQERAPLGEGVDRACMLFAHFLWGSSLLVTDGIERASSSSTSSSINSPFEAAADGSVWSVKGHDILELGAGAALSSIVSVLAGAESVTVTDHPLAPGLYGSIQANIDRNIPKHLAHRISVQPYQWGVLDQGGSVDEEELETAYLDQMAGFAAANRARFSRIICADCLWMPSQHENLIQTLLWFLAPSSGSPAGIAWVVAGLHTGRHIVASFFQKAVSAGLKIEKIWERDMNSTEGETTREWKPVREDEGPENRARWCIVGLLSR